MSDHKAKVAKAKEVAGQEPLLDEVQAALDDEHAVDDEDAAEEE